MPSIPHLAAALLSVAALQARADGSLLRPLGGPGAAWPAPWQIAGLPHQKKPFTTFSMVELDGRHALRVQADASYGNLVHPLHLEAAALHLEWQWRVDQLLADADLHTRAGDDTALKVCVLFDLPLDHVPFVERQLLRVARAASDEPLPGATVCYVWDTRLPPGTTLANAFTRRLRYLVLESGAPQPHEWRSERRDVEADFVKLFGDESAQVPTVLGIAVGADADNTQSHSLGHVAELMLAP